MFKSQFAREMLHYSSLSEEQWFRDDNLDPGGGQGFSRSPDFQQEDLAAGGSRRESQTWMDAATFQKILDTSERFEDKTNKNVSKQRFSHGSLSSDEPHSGRTTPTPPPIIEAPAQLRQTLAGGNPRDAFKRPHNIADNRRHSLVQSDDSRRSFLQPADLRGPRRSVSSSSTSEDHLEELIPGGTVLQLSRIFETGGEPGGSQKTSFPPPQHSRSHSRGSLRSSRSSVTSNQLTRSTRSVDAAGAPPLNNNGYGGGRPDNDEIGDNLETASTSNCNYGSENKNAIENSDDNEYIGNGFDGLQNKVKKECNKNEKRPSKQQQPSQPVLKPDFRLDSYPENLATPSHLRQSMPCLPGGGGYYPTPKPRHSMAFNSARGFVGAPYNYNEEDSLLGLGAGPEMACSTPSQISKVETVLSFGARLNSEMECIQNLESEINNLRRENTDLNTQLLMAKESARKYKALEKEVDHLTWQLSKMEDSRKVYERATNQLVLFLDQVSEQLSTNSSSRNNSDRFQFPPNSSLSDFADFQQQLGGRLGSLGGGQLRPEQILQNRLLYGSILGESSLAMNRAQSRQSWGGFNGGNGGVLPPPAASYRQQHQMDWMSNGYASVGKHSRDSRSSLGFISNRSNLSKLDEKRRGNQSCWNLSSNNGGDDTDTAPSIISNGGKLNSHHPKNPLRAAKSERNITTIKDESIRTSTLEKNLISKRKLFHQQSNKVPSSASSSSLTSKTKNYTRHSSDGHLIPRGEEERERGSMGIAGEGVGEEVEGVSLESKDSGRSTDSGSGRSTPKTPQSRDQLCKRAKHLVKAMKHFLAREKSKFSEDKKSKKLDKDLIEKSSSSSDTRPLSSHRSGSQTSSLVRSNTQTSSSLRSNPQTLSSDPPSVSDLQELENTNNKIVIQIRPENSEKPPSGCNLKKKSHSMNLHSSRPPAKPARLFVNKSKAALAANDNDNEKYAANLIKITKMGTVSVPVPYPIFNRRNENPSRQNSSDAYWF